MKKRFWSTLSIITGIICLIVSLFLGARNIYEQYHAEQFSREVVSELDKILETSASAENIKEYQLYPDMEMPTIEIDGYRYIGKIEIFEQGTELPVMTDWSYPQLKISPCRYKGSIYKDNAILMAHNYPHSFGLLYQLSPKSKVRFTDVEGNEFNYELMDVETLFPKESERLEADGNWDLTLFACLEEGRTRQVARFKRIHN